MLVAIFILASIVPVFFYVKKKYYLFILSFLILLYSHPLFQKMTDPTMFGESFYDIGFIRVKLNIVILISSLAIIMLRRFRFIDILNFKKILLWLFIIMILHIPNFLFSMDIPKSFYLYIISVIAPILFFLSVYTIDSYSITNVSKIHNVFILSTIMFLFIGVIMYMYNLGQSTTDGFGYIRSGGGIWMSNIATQFMAFMFPFVFTKEKSIKGRLLQVILFILFSFLFIVAQSRMAVIVLVLQVLLLSRLEANFRIIGFGIFFYLIVYFLKIRFDIDIVSLFIDRVTDGGTSSALSYASENERFELWKASIEVFKSYPLFGIGIGNYNLAYFKGYSNAHNIFFNILAERGIFIFAVIVAMFYHFLRINKLCIKNSLNKKEKNFFQRIRIGFLGFMFIGLSGNDLFSSSGYVIAWPTYMILLLYAIQLKYIYAINVKKSNN